jgi:hypothetical protein
MKLRRSLYARPEIVRGQHCIRGALLDKTVVRRLVAGVFNGSNLEVIDELYGYSLRSSVAVPRDAWSGCLVR